MHTENLSPKALEIFENPNYMIRIITFGPHEGKIEIRGKSKNVDPVKELSNCKSEIAEIKAMLKIDLEEQENARKERQARIDAIPGLKEIKANQRELEDWDDRFEKQWESEDGVVSMPNAPANKIVELRKQYPVASAYIKAESYAYSNNYVKCAAGKKALEAIIAGDDHVTAIAEMEKTWSDYCEERIFD